MEDGRLGQLQVDSTYLKVVDKEKGKCMKFKTMISKKRLLKLDLCTHDQLNRITLKLTKKKV